MTPAELREHLSGQLVEPIAYHRAQRGDERCWFDDYYLYRYLPEAVSRPVKLSRKEMAARCGYYRDCRSNEESPEHPATSLTDECDQSQDKVSKFSRHELTREIRRLRRAIRQHQQVGMFELTVDDDQHLYEQLDDGLEADFRLPPRELFLENCALICSLVNTKDVDLSNWPNGRTSPLAWWQPGMTNKPETK